MAIVLVDNKKTALVDTIETFYTNTSTGSGAIITAFTVTNDTTSSKTYKAYIFDSTGATVNSVIPQKTVVRDRFDVGSSIINQVIPSGGTLRIESSAANALNFYVSGIEQ